MRASGSVRSEIGNLPALDGLRGVAVLWVIAFHAFVLRKDLGDPWIDLAASSTWLGPVIGSGYLGVDLFFLLSGFLLALPWFVHAIRGQPPPSAREFYARRARRILPAYYAQLVLLFAVVLPLLRGLDYWRSDLYVYVYNLVTHATFLHNTTPLSSGSMQVNGALWTLAVEAQFYLLVPLVAPLVVRWPRPALAVSFAIAIAWRLATHDGLGPLVAFEMALGRPWGWTEDVVRYLLLHQLPSYCGHFVLGMVLGGACLTWREGGHSRAARRALDAGLALALGLLYWTIAIDGRIAGNLTWAIPALCLGFLLWRAAVGGGAGKALAIAPLAFAGRVSYSAYLLHLPLQFLWNRYAAALPPWLSLPLYLAAVLALSWLSWRFIERPFLRPKGADSRPRVPLGNEMPLVDPR
ncbi:MAG TPA: acyltransferase [Usitatibacter sp.]